MVLVDPDGLLELDIFSYDPQSSNESKVDLNYVNFHDQDQARQFSFTLPAFNQVEHVFGMEVEAYGSIMDFQWYKNGEPIEGALRMNI